MKSRHDKAPRSSELLIIGSGAVGAACAATLARAGQRVRVLSTPGRITTSISGGHLLLQTKLPGPRLELARRSQELVAALAAGEEEALGYRQTGSLILAADPEEAELLRAHQRLLLEAGVALQWLTGDEARDLEPELAPGVMAASFCPVDAQVDPSALAGAFLQEAVRHRAAIVSNAPVESFVRTAGRISGVIAGGQEYAASAVVLAAGPWSGELARLAGVELGMRPRRGVFLRGECAWPLASRPLLGAGYLRAKFSTDQVVPAATFSLQQHPDGLCVLGATREFVEWSKEGLETAGKAIQREGARYLPALAEVPWGAPGAGFRPWMPDRQFRIGESGVPGLLLCCGFEGDGITLAAAAAEQLAAHFQ